MPTLPFKAKQNDAKVEEIEERWDQPARDGVKVDPLESFVLVCLLLEWMLLAQPATSCCFEASRCPSEDWLRL